jgi:hypothetical protein
VISKPLEAFKLAKCTKKPTVKLPKRATVAILTFPTLGDMTKIGLVLLTR